MTDDYISAMRRLDVLEDVLNALLIRLASHAVSKEDMTFMAGLHDQLETSIRSTDRLTPAEVEYRVVSAVNAYIDAKIASRRFHSSMDTGHEHRGDHGHDGKEGR